MSRAYDFRQVPAHLIRRAHQRAAAIFMEEMLEFDVTPVQFAILMTLLERPRLDQVTLAQHVALDAATSGSVITRLEGRGWLERECDQRDRRRKLLWLTPEGERQALQMAQLGPQIQERLVAPLDAHERAELVRLLSKIENGPL